MARRLRASLSGLIVLAFASGASAGHHRWIISELYSNADGTVQFVELLGTANNEQNLNGFNVETFGTIPTSAPLGPNLPSTLTAGKYVLVATAGYEAMAKAQGAPAPDRVLPDNFLQIDADTVRYAAIAATDRTYTNIPTDGIDSIDYENPTGTVNTPENFAGDTGTIDATGPDVPVLGDIAFGLLALALAATGAVFMLRQRRTA